MAERALGDQLLLEARDVLDRYQTEGSYNNYDVIKIIERIDAYFREDEPLQVASCVHKP